MTRSRTTRPPLDRRHLEDLALRYVGRFATTRKRLHDYLMRKLRERGWDGEGEPPVAGIVERLSNLGYVDDPAFALARARSLTGKGYGPRRIAGALAAAGVGESDADPALRSASDGAGDAILRFARRRRIGPFAVREADRPTQEKWLAAMVRAGHDFALARRIAQCAPGAVPDADELFD